MDYRRYYQPGGTYFFTVVTEQRQPLLIKHIDRLRAAFRHGMDRYPFTIDGIVILPDHLQWIISTTTPLNMVIVLPQPSGLIVLSIAQ